MFIVRVRSKLILDIVWCQLIKKTNTGRYAPGNSNLVWCIDSKWILTCFPGDHRLGSLKDDAVELGGLIHQNVVGVKRLMMFCRGGAFHPLMSSRQPFLELELLFGEEKQV